MRATVLRVLAFVRVELVGTLRQPRLLLTLVLGPFLVLLVFGLGYDESLPSLSTVVVGEPDTELVTQVDEFVREEEPAGIAYLGTTADRDAAMAQLGRGEVDLVVVLPDAPVEELGRDEPAVIEVHQRSLDPITASQIYVAADSAVSDINDTVVEQVVATLQERTSGFGDDLQQARDQLAEVRSRVSDEDLRTAQQGADDLSRQLDRVADALDGGLSIGQALGLGGRVAEVQEVLRDAATQLADIADVDAVATLDETEATLADLDEALTQLQDVDPAVVVRPFQADVISDTPVDVTLDRFYAPGLVALMLQHVALTFAALGLVRERRQRTTRLFAATPVTMAERLAGKAIAYLVMGGVAAAALIALVIAVFGVPLPMAWGPFLGLVALTLLASIGYGFLVAAMSDTDSQAVQFSMLFLLTAIFFSGLFLPLDRIGMPSEVVTWLTPATYAFTGLQQLMLQQRAAPGTLFAGLAAIAVVSTVVAGWWLSRRERRLS